MAPAAGIFYVGYCLFEVPSNSLALYRYGARRWLARIMITGQGLFAALPASGRWAQQLCGDPPARRHWRGGVLSWRHLLSHPVVSVVRFRTRMMGWFLAAIPLSSVFSGPLSVSMLELDGWLGLHGWQWLFIILQGLPACVLGVLGPAHADRSPRQRDVADRAGSAPPWHRPSSVSAARRFEHLLGPALERRTRLAAHGHPVQLRSSAFWALACGCRPSSRRITCRTPQVGFATALPYVVGALAMLEGGLAWWRGTQRYVLHLVITCAVAALGFFACRWRPMHWYRPCWV
ncbi:hypothetical protein ACU4HD_48110 [Cupriavidus basilensis]